MSFIYPVDSDIQALVATNAGIPVPAGFSFSGYAAAAVMRWEEMTGWIPFLANSYTTVRLYDPPGRKPPTFGVGSKTSYGGERHLNLGCGYISTVTVVANGAAMVDGKDYRLLPINAPANRRPYSRIEFFNPIWGGPGSIFITGFVGFCSTLSQDQFEAIVKLGAASAAEDILQGIFASPSMIKTQDEATQQDSFRELGAGWLAFAERTALMYRYVATGI